MKPGLIWRRWIAAVMAVTILVMGAPLAPAAAAPCDHQGMAMASSMPMDMKAMPAKSQMPAKHGMPCGDSGLNCLAGVGCAAPVAVQSIVTFLPRISMADTSWTVQIAGSGIAHKPALPPPILRA